jgi:hypothetical protein
MDRGQGYFAGAPVVGAIGFSRPRFDRIECFYIVK